MGIWRREAGETPKDQRNPSDSARFAKMAGPFPPLTPTLENIVIYGGDTVGKRRDYGQAPYVMELMLVTTKVGRWGA